MTLRGAFNPLRQRSVSAVSVGGTVTYATNVRDLYRSPATHAKHVEPRCV